MNHLVYFTFGEQEGSVYATQVKQLLNYWAKKENWKITLFQIADKSNLNGLDPTISCYFIKRKLRVLIPYHIKYYCNEIKNKLEIDKKNKIYFNSRGVFAYSIATSFLEKSNLKADVNNLDIRGTIEEFKISFTRKLIYPYFRYFLIKELNKAKSVTTVSHALKEHLVNDYILTNDNMRIFVNPSLSIQQYDKCVLKKDIAYIGKIAWISPDQFAKGLLLIKDAFSIYGWKISIIGNTSSTCGLENHGIEIVPRMSPEKLVKFTSSFHTGVILRDNSIINKVAAPCKVSDYLCQGMPIIYSGEIGSLKDFLYKYPECNKYLIHIDNLKETDKVAKHVNLDEKDFIKLSNLATSYFGIKAVTDRYIEIFTSKS